MRPVTVLILLPPPTGPPATPVGWLDEARAVIARHHADLFRDVGADDVRIVTQPDDGRPFGARLRALVSDLVEEAERAPRGLVVIGGGSMPLARRDDLAQFLAAANGSATRGTAERALANSYYSADAFAVPDAAVF